MVEQQKMANLVVRLLEETTCLKGCLDTTQSQPQVDTKPKTYPAKYLEVARPSQNDPRHNPCKVLVQEVGNAKGAP